MDSRENNILQRSRLWLPLLAMLILLLGACGPGANSTASPAEQGAANEDLNISLAPAGSGTQGDALTVILTDAEGEPITDAQVALEGNMNHAGMAPVFADAVTDEADGAADGRYRLPFTFTMLGDWIITVEITRPGGDTIERDLDIRVSEESVSGEQVVEASSSDTSSANIGGEPAGNHADAVHVHEPKARPAPLEGGAAAIYLTLHNGSDTPLHLVGGETAVAAGMEVHESINDDGVIRMRHLEEGLALEPDGSVTLAPGGIHIMLVDLVSPLEEGDNIELTLRFADGRTLNIDVPVVSISETMPDRQEEEGQNH